MKDEELRKLVNATMRCINQKYSLQDAINYCKKINIKASDNAITKVVEDVYWMENSSKLMSP